MILSTVSLFVLALGLCIFAQVRREGGHRTAAQVAVKQFAPLALRLPATILAAGFGAAFLPQEAIARVLGQSSGLYGVIVASLLGGLLPGGPIVTFPIVVIIADAGAGRPQIIALLTAWAVMAAHRIVAFEMPSMGGRFVGTRLAASFLLPPLAGILASALDLL